LRKADLGDKLSFLNGLSDFSVLIEVLFLGIDSLLLLVTLSGIDFSF